MGAISSIKVSTLATGIIRTSDPAIGTNKSFDPEGWNRQTGAATYVDRSSGVPLVYPRYSFLLRPPSKDGDLFRILTKLRMPIQETIDPSVGIFGPKVAYALEHHSETIIPSRATGAERLLFRALVRCFYMTTVNASDDLPTDATLGPWGDAMNTLEDVY